MLTYGGRARERAASSFLESTFDMNTIVTRPSAPASPEPWPISLLTRAANSRLETTVLVRESALRNSPMASPPRLPGPPTPQPGVPG